MRWFKPGEGILLVLGLIPVAIFLLNHWPSPSTDPVVWFRWSGRLVGVVGLTLLLLAALMSLRLPKLDLMFGGLPRLWRIHRLVGFMGFVNILLHAWLLGFATVTQGRTLSLAGLFPDVANWPIWAGWLALALMVVFLAPTFQFFGRLNYQRWKRLHLLSAPALVLGLIHTLPLADQPLVWWVLGALSIGAIVWRKVLSPHLGRSAWEVAEVRQLKHDVVEICLKPLGEPMRYMAGQFVYLTPQVPGLSAGNREEHPYTIASAPSDPMLRLGIKDLGDASHALQQVPPGSRVDVEGPYGDFYLRHYPKRDQLWLGGGIGITPFVSGARAMLDDQTDASVHLFYLSQDEYRSYYLDELQNIAVKQSRFDITAHHFSVQGAVTVAFLEEHCPDFRDREVYLCGPPGMMKHLIPLLKRAGITGNAIHSEVFDFL
ncbi:ferredoxin reductase family protein [Saccharospirillum impatiens]|uniref:ferredoxin reductase family protein n=1 Tax=Saccharospirillum impatiens TaxID=169438 RepID=UPI000420B7AA|nr:ferredoxin reductase family protein [Saccharospirillum impatiens]